MRKANICAIFKRSLPFRKARTKCEGIILFKPNVSLIKVSEGFAFWHDSDDLSPDFLSRYKTMISPFEIRRNLDSKICLLVCFICL